MNLSIDVSVKNIVKIKILSKLKHSLSRFFYLSSSSTFLFIYTFDILSTNIYLLDTAQEAFRTLLREFDSTTPTPTSLVAPITPAIPSSAIPSLAGPSLAGPSPTRAQYTSTRFADLRSNTVSGNRLAYTKKFKEAEEARKAAKEASKQITMIVIFYLQEKPGETNPIPDSIYFLYNLEAKANYYFYSFSFR